MIEVIKDGLVHDLSPGLGLAIWHDLVLLGEFKNIIFILINLK